jgi:hypothetical protein
LQVDLGDERSIDTIALVPAYAAVGEYPGQGYGFPPRFRVELANDAAFTLPQLVADFTREDFPNPGVQPVVIQVGPTDGAMTEVRGPLKAGETLIVGGGPKPKMRVGGG